MCKKGTTLAFELRDTIPLAIAHQRMKCGVSIPPNSRTRDSDTHAQPCKRASVCPAGFSVAAREEGLGGDAPQPTGDPPTPATQNYPASVVAVPERCLEAGADDYLSKLPKLDELTQAILRLTAKRPNSL